MKLGPPLGLGPERIKEVARYQQNQQNPLNGGPRASHGAGRQYLEGGDLRAEAARTHGLTVVEVEDWREKFLLGAENALRSRPRDEEALKDEQIKKLKQKIGDLVPISYGRP